MTDKPSLSELLAQPSVVAGLRQAYVDSDVGGLRPREQGGFLVRETQTGIIIDNDGLVSVVGRTAEVLRLEAEEPNP